MPDSQVAVDAESAQTAVNRCVAATVSAAPLLDALGRGGRAELLRTMAAALGDRRAEIVGVADHETAIGEVRLTGELSRTTFQMELFAQVLEEGSYLEATLDSAGETPMGPRPDVRRMLVPIGPVAVFGASNFPLAFSVPGGDTVSALAAGNPVVLKAHPSHPATSQLCFDIMTEAAIAAGAPAGALAIVHGIAAGAALVAHPAIRAVGFTGSMAGAQALMDIINRRLDPIPFYGELSSLNPLVVTPAAARARGAELGEAIADSFTLASGQLCTKPGVFFVPAGKAGDTVVSAAAARIAADDVRILLNLGIKSSYEKGTDGLAATTGVQQIRAPERDERGVRASLYEVRASDLEPARIHEIFGPISLAVRYDGERELFESLAALPASLTLTLHSGSGEESLVSRLTQHMRGKAGRMIYDGFPTGVAVTWAQTHGGPWPSTNSLHTSVGTTAIRRFLRPVTWQSAPAHVLPPELQDAYTAIPRRLDGRLQLGASNLDG